MATWQFNLFLIPRVSLLNRYKRIPIKLYVDHGNGDDRNKKELEAYEINDALDIAWWNDLNTYTSDLLPIIEKFATVDNSWHTESSRNFGAMDNDLISVGFNENTKQIEEVSCRFDLRKFNKNFVDKTLSLAKQFDCLLMDNRGTLIQPNLPDLLKLIESSNAFRFVSDPEKFLNDLSEDKIKL